MYVEDENEENPLAYYWMEGDSLAPPCQTDINIVRRILEIVQPTKDDILYDLGCGDGRICVEASRIYGCQSCGVEIEQHLIDKFNANIQQFNLHHLTKALWMDLLEVDMSSATIIVLYLLPEAIDMIAPKLEAALKRGAKLLCNTWGPKTLRCNRKCKAGESNNVDLLYYDRDSLSIV